MSTASTPEIIEHLVLFKIKPNAHPSQISTFINGLNSLTSLNQVLYLTAGPIHKTNSPFTHMLHTRYKTKDDLYSYAAHPDHVRVVQQSSPIIEDIMALDWLAKELTLPQAFAMRVTFLKLKQGLGDEEKDEIYKVVGRGCESFGENFSPERAKGFEFGSLAVVKGVNELEGLGLNEELLNSKKEVQEWLVFDYVSG